MYNDVVNELKSLSESVSNFCVGMEGNVSGKVSKTKFLIKASGSKLNVLGEEDLIECDIFGNQLSNLNKKPSMELGFHTWLLSFESINFVSHTHPNNTLKILCSDKAIKFSEERLFPDQVIFNGKKSCFVPYTMPGDKLTNKIKESMNLFTEKQGYVPSLILLENHGIITFGKTIDECIISTQICEKSAEIFVGVDNPKFLSLEEIEEIQTDKKENYRKSLLK
jgi:ribulose-5-phosphate 4-epimerase/fuculose-1-phosphate aldolase